MDRLKAANCRYTIGVDFGGTYVKLALVRFCEKDYRIEGFSAFQTQNYNRDALIEQLVIRIIKLKAESTYKGNRSGAWASACRDGSILPKAWFAI